MLYGTIIKGIGGFYYVSTKNGVYECRARGIFRKDNIKPLIGDYVEISVLDEKNKKGSLDVICERKNELIRPTVANINQSIIVFAVKSPKTNLDLLDRFIILSEEQGLDILICLNKIDLDNSDTADDIKKIYEKTGYRVLLLSATENIGTEILKKELEGKISVFAGPSGVGKSSLINTLSSGFNLNTGEISEKIERGKHTTRHAELLKMSDDTFIVDSPGFTSLSISHIKSSDLKKYFIEFEPYTNCRYTECSHTHEPDCDVKEHIDKSFYKIRYDRYVSLYNELKEKERIR